jgi:predicted transcriptional regulator
MGHRRSRIELYVDILQAIAKGRRSPAKIVYAANLSYDRVVKHVGFLKDQNLIEGIDGTKNRYQITEKGVDIIRYFQEIESALFSQKRTYATINVHFTPSL